MVMFRRVVDSKEQFRTHFFLCSDREIEKGEAKKIVYHIYFLLISLFLSLSYALESSLIKLFVLKISFNKTHQIYRENYS